MPEPTPGAWARREAASAQTEAAALRLRLAVTSPSASILRTELADWLRHLGTANGTIFDLQLACTEVLTIMIGQPGQRSALIMELEGTMTDNTVTVTIREFGLCRQPGHPPASLDQSLSLNLIEAMTDSLDIHENTQGRTFTLRRRIREHVHPLPVGERPATARAATPLTPASLSRRL